MSVTDSAVRDPMSHILKSNALKTYKGLPLPATDAAHLHFITVTLITVSLEFITFGTAA